MNDTGEFRFDDNSPACSADACGIFERLEAILAEIRGMRADGKMPKAVHLSADDLHSLSKRR